MNEDDFLTRGRFIATPIMSEEILKALDEKLHEGNSDWALAEDSVKAVMRIAADKSINGM